ncbi:MAG: S9 family peptidase, partial [Acidobacteria bacterium]|nr:S9 family peptidase [Acidobacteriota bacterium]
MTPRTPSLLVATLLMMSSILSGSRLSASPWTVDDLILAEGLGDWTVAPDGLSVIWVRTTITEVEGEEKPVSNLWRSRLEGGPPTALTRSNDRLASPAYSPDGRFLAFLSDRKPPGKTDEDRGEQQVWVLPVDGGEAYPATDLDRSVSAFDWIGNDALVVLAPESPSAWERERKQLKDKTIVVDDLDREPPTRLFRVSLGEEITRLTTNRRWISSLAAAFDGRHAVVTVQQDLKYSFDEKNRPLTYLVDLESGAMERLFEGEERLPSQVRWAPDSSGFYFVDELTTHPRYRQATIRELYFYDLDGNRTSKVGLDWPRGLGSEYLPLADGVLVLLEDGVAYRPAKISRDGASWSRRDLDGERAERIRGWRLSRDGRTLAFLHSTATRPPQLFGARLEGSGLRNVRQLSDLNAGFADKPTGQVEVIHFPGAGGDSVEALLHYPLDWPKNKAPSPAARRPLVLDIHGGPAGTDRDFWDQRWSGPLLLYRQRGAFVLQVNYHGSAGYGLEWVESIAERYYEQERVDLEAGVDHLVDQGLVDPERL